MTAYIQCQPDGQYYNINAYLAAQGFRALGYEVLSFREPEEIRDEEPDAICVGGVATVRSRLRKLGFPIPPELEYPPELAPYLNRKIWKASLSQLAQEEKVDIFIKPVETKLFPGKVIRHFRDYIGLPQDRALEVWCSEVVNLHTEWRCFVRYNQLWDVRYYRGKWDSRLDVIHVQKAIADFKSQPAAYCLDFGVDALGKYYLVEVNDGHSLGSYGMGAISYAKFLSARWAEMTGSRDYLK